MPVVFTPYLKNKLGVADAEESPEPVTSVDNTVELLTRREFLAGIAAAGIAVLALRRRRADDAPAEPEA
ncbi:hypothetical protein [Halovenus halobia]|uniref:hypothetical protein n=1 Tax=Halovenus halobia TaxID=3396622 RepID=UPI003F544C80